MDAIDDERSGGASTPESEVIEAVVDPIVAIAGESIHYVNEAAEKAFELSGGEEATALGEKWERLEPVIADTCVGSVATVDLDEYEAHVHRGSTTTTVVFVPTESGDASRSERAPTSQTDQVLKARAVDEAPVGVVLSDPGRPDNPLVYSNEAYREITGYAFGDVVGRNCRFLQGPESDPKSVARMRAAIDAERPVTAEVKNYRRDGTEFWNEITIAPVRNDDGETTHFVGFQNDVTARKRAEIELSERTDELEYILDRIEGLMQDVTRAVVGSTTRSALESDVCERIAQEPAYRGAWIGERNPATGTIDVRTSEAVSQPAAVSANHPAVKSLDTQEPAVGIVDGATHAAFPLTYGGIEYGVLIICATEDRAVDERESVVLSALSRTVASGINARETSRMLATDAVVAVDVELTDTALPTVALSAETDARFEYRRSVHRTGAEAVSLFTATGASPDELAEAAAVRDGMTLDVLVDRAEGCLVEVRAKAGIVGWLSDRSVSTESIEAENGRARVTFSIPRSANVRSVVEAIEARYEGTEVRSFHQREREGVSHAELAATLETELTERQFSSLQRAYLGGYFEWPRPTTGADLARTMGVSRPTFHEHLRMAEAKLCRAFFGDD